MDDPKRTKRVGQIKKLIVAFLMLGIILPISVCILLVMKVVNLQEKLDSLTDELVSTAQIQKPGEAKEESPRPLDLIIDESTEGAIGEQTEAQIEAEQTERFSQLGKRDTAADGATDQSEIKTKVYLTFDDGPSSNTDEILDILKEYDVKATFFVIAREEEQFLPMYQRIIEEGHTLGMHSYSHKYGEIYASEQDFWTDLEQLQDFLYQATGKWPRFYRFPGGSSNRVSRTDMQTLTQQLIEQDLKYLDWNISCGDATGARLSASQIADNVTRNVLQYETAVVLMHDAADKRSTVDGLRIILERLSQMEQVEILPVTDDMDFIVHDLY